MKHEQKVEFTPPKGFSAPEGTEDGKFSMVCDFEFNDGKICMTKLGDVAMPGYSDEDHEEKEHKPSYGDYASRMSNGQMPVNQPGTGDGGGYA